MKFQRNISLCIALLSVIGLPAVLITGTLPIFFLLILTIGILSIYHARALVKSISHYDEIDKRINLIESSDSAKLINQLDESLKELNLLKSKNDKYDSEINRYKSEVSSLKNEKENLLKNLTNIESTIKTLEEKVASLNIENIEYKNKCLKFDYDNKKTDLLINEKNNNIKELETKLEDYEEKYSNLKEKYFNLKEEKRTLSIDLKKESMKNTFKEFGNFVTYESTVERMYKDEYEKNDFEIYITSEIPCDGVVVHVDTTGLDCYKDSILKISAIKFDDFSIIDSFESLVKFDDIISSKSKSIHHIEESDVINAPSIKLVLDNFLAFLSDNTIVCHTDFDMKFINQALFKNGFYELENKVCMTINLSKSLIPYLSSYSLDKLISNLDLDYDDSIYNNKVIKCFSLLLYLYNLKNL